ncbi:MAG TPA: hypothetical protein P5144_12755 [Thermoanaerobaculia bacterium]|nr:hypothetical protein [Thermoanaerobaculia bacterium]
MKYLLTRSCRPCLARRRVLRGVATLVIPARVGFGDAVADWIHTVAQRRLVLAMCRLRFPAPWVYAVQLMKPCAACQRRRSILNRLFPYIPCAFLEWRAWNAYLASGLDQLPVVWDSDTGAVSRLDGS